MSNTRKPELIFNALMAKLWFDVGAPAISRGSDPDFEWNLLIQNERTKVKHAGGIFLYLMDLVKRC